MSKISKLYSFIKTYSLVIVVILLILFPLFYAYLKGLRSKEVCDIFYFGDALQQMINGTSLGFVYALIAIGYTMVYGIIELINFAHGEIYMIGAYLSFFFIANFKLSAILSVILAVAATALLGVIIELIAYRPLRSAPRLNLLISAIGVSIILSYGSQIVFGPNPQSFPIHFENSPYEFLGVKINFIQVLIMLVSCALMALLALFVKYTKIGMAMRACALDRTCAALMGINVNFIISLTFAIGSALAAVGGILVGIRYNEIQPTMGYLAGIKAFSAAVLGGIGSIPGAMLGGVLIGLMENLFSAYISSGYKDAFAFIVLILVLLIKPSGLLKSEGRVKV